MNPAKYIWPIIKVTLWNDHIFSNRFFPVIQIVLESKIFKKGYITTLPLTLLKIPFVYKLDSPLLSLLPWQLIHSDKIKHSFFSVSIASYMFLYFTSIIQHCNYLFICLSFSLCLAPCSRISYAFLIILEPLHIGESPEKSAELLWIRNMCITLKSSSF